MASTIHLTNTTGYSHIDAVLHSAIGIFEAAFPERIISYYLTGSYADNTAVPESDLDLIAVFRDVGLPVERDRFLQICHHLTTITPIWLDCTLYNAETLTTEARADILNAQLIYGVDDRPTYQLEPIERHIARSTAHIFTLMQVLRGNADNLVAPLRYPAESEKYHGYEHYGMDLNTDAQIQGLRNLVSLVTRIPTVLVALETGQRAGTKRDAITLYRRHINDEWISFISDVYQTINLRWHYQMPTAYADRQQLHDITQWLLGFENYFLERMREVLLGYLSHPSETVRYHALRALNAVTYSDAAAVAAIRQLQANDELDEVHNTLIQSLQHKVAVLD